MIKIGLGFGTAAFLALLFGCSTPQETLDNPGRKRSFKAPERRVVVEGEDSPLIEEPELAGSFVKDDPMEELRRLWESGLLNEARTRFHQDDILALAHQREDEWHIWRGRLFTEHITGAEIGLAGENISALFVDQDDLWAGTWTGGISRLAVPIGYHRVWDPGIPSLAVRTVNRIGKSHSGVSIVRYGAVQHFDRRSSRWTYEKDLPVDERMQDLASIASSRFLATLGRGLWTKSGTGAWELLQEPGPFITRLEVDGDWLLVATMDRGLHLYNVVNREWRRPPEGPLRQINVTSVVRVGNSYIGGSYGDGAFVWDLRRDTVRFLDAERLGDPYVLAVLEHDEWVYFGTFGGGLRSWHPESDKWDNISLPDGLPSADVASLASDSDSIWVGTLGGGIVRIDEEIHGP